MVLNEHSKLGNLLNNEASAAVLEKYWPGVSADPAVYMLHEYTLKEIAEFPQANLPQDKLAEIAADLAAIHN
ncbi:hypothetical protein D3C76_38440 [compost metagenome]